MKVYDCIPFFDELDILEIRMEMLNDIVDYFVVQESNKTFQGNDKPFYYQENKERFKKFEHKVINIVFTDDKGSAWNNWDRDLNHKNNLSTALTHCDDNDIILLSDTDEIPNPIVLKDLIENKFKQDHLYVFAEQEYCCYYLDAYIVNVPWFGTKVTNWGLLKRYSFDNFNHVREPNCKFNVENPGKYIRIEKKDYDMSIGWHYTNLGGLDKVIRKFKSYSHQEYNYPEFLASIKNKIKNLTDIIGRSGFDAVKIKFDKRNCPHYLLDNINKYQHLMCNEDNWRGNV